MYASLTTLSASITASSASTKLPFVASEAVVIAVLYTSAASLTLWLSIRAIRLITSPDISAWRAPAILLLPPSSAAARLRSRVAASWSLSISRRAWSVLRRSVPISKSFLRRANSPSIFNSSNLLSRTRSSSSLAALRNTNCSCSSLFIAVYSLVISWELCIISIKVPAAAFTAWSYNSAWAFSSASSFALAPKYFSEFTAAALLLIVVASMSSLLFSMSSSADAIFKEPEAAIEKIPENWAVSSIPNSELNACVMPL